MFIYYMYTVFSVSIFFVYIKKSLVNKTDSITKLRPMLLPPIHCFNTVSHFATPRPSANCVLRPNDKQLGGQVGKT